MHTVPSAIASNRPVSAPAGAFGATILRPLRRGDAAAFASHLKRLGERGRRLRFGSPVSDAFLEAYAQRQLSGGAHLIGLFAAGTLRGVGELCPHADPASAEAAFSLERLHRGAGLGGRLFEALLAEARRRGLTNLTLQFLRENVAMQRLARRFSAKLSFEGSEVIASIALSSASPYPATARQAAELSPLLAA